MKLFLKKTTTNKFQRYSPKIDNELITENEYEKGKTNIINDLIVTTGFSNPMYSENIIVSISKSVELMNQLQPIIVYTNYTEGL